MNRTVPLVGEALMRCPFCDHERVHKHGKTAKGIERFKCPLCQQTFTQTFDTLFYRRQVSETEVHHILQSHQEGVSIRGISRLTGRALGTVTEIVNQASAKAQMVHNQEVSEVEVEAILSDEMWSFVPKNKPSVSQKKKNRETAGSA
jgi:transposase-like protein